MPMLVRTPEDIFREEKKDLYVIHSKEDFERDAPGLVMIQAWIKETFPHVRIELLAPSEHSGFITGGIGRQIRIDFSDDELQAFCDRWEDNNASVDPRFQCYIHCYAKWFENHGRFLPTVDKPTSSKPGPTVWVFTPMGFIHHQLATEEIQPDHHGAHPASARDIWMHATQKWPELAKLSLDELTYGSIVLGPGGGEPLVLYCRPFLNDGESSKVPSADQIREWFNLPATTEVIEDSF